MSETRRKTFKYRIYPHKATTEKLQWTLDRCRELYNAALQERKEAYKYAKKSITCYEQINDLPEIKNEIRLEYQEIAAHVLQDVLRRLDKAFKNFFRRIRNGEKPGYPRFQGRNHYDSFTYPDSAGWKLEVTKEPEGKKKGKAILRLTKIGDACVVLHRPIEGAIKTVTIKREGECWFVVCSCAVTECEKLSVSYEDVGIDLGVTHFAALSDGTFIESPRYYRKAEKKLEKLQQTLSRKKRGSHRRKKAVRVVAQAHRKIRNQRRDFVHKASRKLVNTYQVIVFEDVQTSNLVKRPKHKQDENGTYLPNGASTKAGLNKSIADAGWYSFTEMTKVKAEWAGRTVLFVNPYKTSQICSGCGTEVKKDLSERWHSCPCGVELDRDTNAAKNILAVGHKHFLGGKRPTLATA